MPWQLELRDGKHCVVKKGESSPVPGGCHESRADAIKHQRALYANESRMASMYAELDARPDPEPVAVEQPASGMSAVTAEIMALLLREEKERSLVASVAESQSLISQQFAEAAAERQALVAALGRMGSPTINLPPAEVNVNVPAAEVNFTVPPAEVNVTVESPTVHVPAAQITVQPADVNVVLPERQKTVTFERDPLTQQVTKAEVTET
jgi:hypothetical protein